MPKNDFLARQRQMQRDFFEAGERIGIQKAWDILSLALHSPDIMGRDAWGEARLDRLYKGASELMDYFADAFCDTADADALQDQMDRMLGDIHGDKLVRFPERYPELNQQSYKEPKKKWAK